MNYENLHKLINRYEQNIYFLNDKEHDEKFKWHAVQQFQNIWFATGATELPFSELFNQAKKGSSVLIDTSTVCPANGVVKLAEQAPEEVERLFREVLFADDDGDLDVRQNNMELFLEGMEKLLQQYYPASWKYRQDRHAASCYLAMFAPEQNYIYKHTPAETFARYIEFGKDIGSGSSFRLAHYYEMCDLIVAALKEHPTLLKKHAELLDETHYQDNSLHLLAFDIIYCASTYDFFIGLSHKTKSEALKHYVAEQKRKAEEEERLAKIEALEAKIRQLDSILDTYRAISLIGIQVTDRKYGFGTVISQNVNQICVLYGDEKRNYIISDKFPMRPTFEDDTEIVAAMTDYEAKEKERAALLKQLQTIC